MNMIPTTTLQRGTLLVLLVAGLVACRNEAPERQADSNHDAAAGAVDQVAGPQAGDADATEPGQVPDAPQESRFRVESVAVSTQDLGDFPYISLPDGYEDLNGKRTVIDFTRAPIWTGDRLEWVEGRVSMGMITAVKGKQFSTPELTRNIEHVVKQAGGVKVAEGTIPKEARDSIPDEVRMQLLDGLGDIWNNPVHTYLIRRDDRNIWIHVCVAHLSGGGWMIVESTPFEPTASLLPSSELKRQLDSDGKVEIQVNFATDKTEILPESRPQIDQVVTLLKDDPQLNLAINGHTDNTGSAAHNLSLSQGRARSVLAALVEQGIDASRLTAQGFGDTQPIADNDTEEGRARNRRVELVRR